MLRAAKRLSTPLFLLLVACTSWHSESLSPSGTRSAHIVAVKRQDGTRIQLKDARLFSDSIVGHIAGTSALVTIPRSQIATIQVRKVSAVNTSLLVLGSALLGWAIMFAALGDQS